MKEFDDFEIEYNDDEFIMNKDDCVEILEALTPSLLQAFFRRCTTERFCVLNVEGYYPGQQLEDDGRVYSASVLRVSAYRTGRKRGIGVYFDVKMSPFDCYFGIQRDKYMAMDMANYTDENLSSCYRQLLEEKFGNSWKSNYYEYLKRVELYSKQLEEEIKEPEEIIF